MEQCIRWIDVDVSYSKDHDWLFVASYGSVIEAPFAIGGSCREAIENLFVAIRQEEMDDPVYLREKFQDKYDCVIGA